MRFVAKAGVLLLALLIGGGQLMVCMLPSATLSAEEQACCKEMGYLCGQDGMPASHPCCKTITPSEQTALSKSAFNLIYHAQLLYVIEPTIQPAGQPQQVSDISASFGHSPPEATSSSLDILRI